LEAAFIAETTPALAVSKTVEKHRRITRNSVVSGTVVSDFLQKRNRSDSDMNKSAS
jgi:hypothetical protein